MSGPLPPADLHGRRPDLIELPDRETLHRFYTAKWQPIYFDRSKTGRFNAPDGSYGVLYTAKDPAGAFAETFLRMPGRTLIDLDLLRRKAYVRVVASRKLTLIRLAGPGLAQLGATAEITHSGLPYDVARLGRRRSSLTRSAPTVLPITPGMTIPNFATRCSTDRQAPSRKTCARSISTRTGSGRSRTAIASGWRHSLRTSKFRPSNGAHIID